MAQYIGSRPIVLFACLDYLSLSPLTSNHPSPDPASWHMTMPARMMAGNIPGVGSLRLARAIDAYLHDGFGKAAITTRVSYRANLSLRALERLWRGI